MFRMNIELLMSGAFEIILLHQYGGMTLSLLKVIKFSLTQRARGRGPLAETHYQGIIRSDCKTQDPENREEQPNCIHPQIRRRTDIGDLSVSCSGSE